MYDIIYKVISSGSLKQGSLYFLDEDMSTEEVLCMSPVDLSVTRNIYKFPRFCFGKEAGILSHSGTTMQLMILID